MMQPLIYTHAVDKIILHPSVKYLNFLIVLEVILSLKFLVLCVLNKVLCIDEHHWKPVMVCQSALDGIDIASSSPLFYASGPVKLNEDDFT